MRNFINMVMGAAPIAETSYKDHAAYQQLAPTFARMMEVESSNPVEFKTLVQNVYRLAEVVERDHPEISSEDVYTEALTEWRAAQLNAQNRSSVRYVL
jgi:hypothetical protein